MKKILFIFIVFIGQNISISMAQNAYNYSFQKAAGGDFNLSDYKGKVLLIVNTASQCGFTGQYKDLQEIYDKYKDRGFEIIAVPSRDFGNQEFAQEDKVIEFTNKNYNISFPVTKISKVSGDVAHPFYLWANESSGFFGSPKWNFHKYLIDKNGNLAKWFSSATKPNSPKIIAEIELELMK